MKIVGLLKRVCGTTLPSLLLGCAMCGAAAEDRPIDGIMDNSFLVEEAYNQERGVVQHILTAFYNIQDLTGDGAEAWELSFTQEWPVFSQTHQFSYTIPYTFAGSRGRWRDGVGDVRLNYRYHAYLDKETLRAAAPRFSLVLPTGDAAEGFGDDTVGYEVNLPFSTAVGDRLAFHLNAGATYLPDAAADPRRDLIHYNLGGSAIYAPADHFHLMLEWIGIFEHSVEPHEARDREFVSMISPGVRKAFNFANGAQLVLGVAVPVGLTSSAPDVGVFLYGSFEHFFTHSNEPEK